MGLAVNAGTCTLTVYRKLRDRYGDLASSTTHTITNCLAAPTESSETEGSGRDTVTSYLHVYVPAGSDISASDSVTLDTIGGSWQVVGEPSRWPVPSSWPYGVEIRLECVTG